ncbi:MAG: acetyl-CoA carboxylase biotin carboxyl carrier protein subunit [Desulfohalobiaceae bacterium]|nr:acetyl-CoA carboxylase biotin carboxyl carrier protein subunit [Desulfohalobiaceae bacterium]
MSSELKAPMPGKVTQILVNVGDQVNQDDEMIIIEAMKMEMPICAPSSGTVKEIKAQEGESVQGEAVLAVIE